ncbi:FAST kinase domain-containing protein 2, mitochondrial isoform X1 [Hypomesus transpacificus]|uniref:FAST kinase domain-containing protein 2, mitochondrial isoform X1 n=1 Tax=Hypomesus transpacificus TaxID=137520 RepID=UPI001F08103F|nr:FAST kinase domain-containing protein 2, mitochondrial isoform X1 [Hypomesus transpacificus]
MSVRLTGEEVLRWVMRTCVQRLPSQHRPPQMHRSLLREFDTGLTPIWRTAGSFQGRLAGQHVNTVRYYCQSKTQDLKAMEAEEHNSIQPVQSPVIQAKRVPFSDKLKECGSPTDVLDLVSLYTATSRRVSNCLTRIWCINKTMTEEQQRVELRLMFEHAGFEELLNTIMLEAGRMRSLDLAYSLLAMVKLGVSPSSRVVQTLLRVSQERLNDFDKKSLSVLASGLEPMKSSPNVDALKEGMRLIIESRLPGIQSVMALQTLMRHMGKDAPPPFKRKLEMKALSMTEQFSLPNCQYMISTLATMGFCSKPLLDVCCTKIADNVHGVPFVRLLTVLRSCRDLHYRNMTLFTAISEYVVSTLDMWSNKQVILFLSVFEDLGFCATPLMDAFLERVLQNPQVLSLKDVLVVLKIFSALNHDLREHRQGFVESMTHVLQTYLPKMSSPDLLRAVVSLCMLGHFPPAPLQQLLQGQTLDELRAAGGHARVRSGRRLQIVDLCLRLDQPPLPQELTVPSSALGSMSPTEPTVNSGLVTTLRSVVGDTGIVQEGVLVEQFYFIDCLISCPLQETEGTTLSEGEAPQQEHSQRSRIAVISTPLSSVCYGTSHPRGMLAMKLRHLKILGYSPVMVMENELRSLPEEERAAVLRAQIFPEHQRPPVEQKEE